MLSQTPAPPLSPYGTFSGDLFQYKTSPSLVAFESSPLPATIKSVSTTTTSNSSSYLSPRKCILLGGLSDGLIPTPYTQDLEKACHSIGWSLVQPMISSSGLGFGHGSLSRDSQELSDLMRYLIHHRNAEIFAFVGHSTGCQNSVHLCKYGDKDLVEKIKVIVLQAPVSDREDAMRRPEYDTNIAHAKKLMEVGKEEEMMPRNAFWAPITAARFLSLQDIGGDDDFFSSDLSDEDLRLRLGHIGQLADENGLMTLVAFSGQDEYVPDGVDKNQLLRRLCEAMKSGFTTGTTTSANRLDSKLCSTENVIPLMLETGNHNLSNDEKHERNKQIFVEQVQKLLSQVMLN